MNAVLLQELLDRSQSEAVQMEILRLATMETGPSCPLATKRCGRPNTLPGLVQVLRIKCEGRDLSGAAEAEKIGKALGIEASKKSWVRALAIYRDQINWASPCVASTC